MKGKTRPCSACPFWKDGDCKVKGIRRIGAAESCAVGQREMKRKYNRERAREIAKRKAGGAPC